MPLRTRFQIAVTLFAAAGATVLAARAGSSSWVPFWLLLLAVLLSSGLKVELPRGDGSMSLNFPFILLGILQLSPLQAMLLAAISVAAQCRIRVRKLFTAVQVCFNVANAMLATGCACLTYASLDKVHVALAPALALASVAYFFWNTVSVAMVLASTKGESAFSLWRKEYPWYLPFYIVGAVLAAIVRWMSESFGWATALLLIPVVYTLYQAYMGQVSRLKERQQHLEETEALQLRTIEGLAMAIEAKDQNTHDHLSRVRQYVKAVAESLGVGKLEMKALETAAFLHDIGKLAVPEHIINKPGKLTPEEFETMKIRPVVGANILERVRFPYPVVPIVRSHHEWWNGSGYPDGLREADIPIGARILTVVDCFDAIVSDRPYRQGMGSEKALALLRSLAGKQFDPAVVAAFERCHAEAEQRAESLAPAGFTPLNTEVDVWRGVAPGAGYEAGSDESASPRSQSHPAQAHPSQNGEGSSSVPPPNPLTHEAQPHLDLGQWIGTSSPLEETIPAVAAHLRRFIPFQVCALFLKQGDALEARFVDGYQVKHPAFGKIRVGEGISGWVAQTGKPILNGNAAVEPGCLMAADGSANLLAAIAIPLFDPQKNVFAVFSVYAATPDVFVRDHLRILQEIEPGLSLSVQNALQRPHPLPETETDPLTGMRNARGFFLQLEAELEHSRQTGQPLSVVVCHLNEYKQLQEHLGHLTGDRVLRSVAECLQLVGSASATVARIGRDEFGLLLPGIAATSLIDQFAAIREALVSASGFAGQGNGITVSLGSAGCPADGSVAEDLLAVCQTRLQLDKQHHHGNATPASQDQESTPQVACPG